MDRLFSEKHDQEIADGMSCGVRSQKAVTKEGMSVKISELAAAKHLR